MAKKPITRTVPPPSTPLTKWEKLLETLREGLNQTFDSVTDTSKRIAAERKRDRALDVIGRLEARKQIITVGKWQGSENILPDGTLVEILAIDFNRLVFIKSACWVRWHLANSENPKYLSCDLSDIDISKLDMLDIFHQYEVNDALVEALKDIRLYLTSLEDNEEKDKALRTVEKMLGIYEESELVI